MERTQFIEDLEKFFGKSTITLDENDSGVTTIVIGNHEESEE